jgi:hypothetical protein
MPRSEYYILFDSARMQDSIKIAIQMNKKNICIYDGKGEGIYKTIGPYIFDFSANISFQNWYYENGWCNSWGYLVHASCSIERLASHFNKFKFKIDEKGDKKYFRYYDPRVLKKILLTMSREELILFFGPVSHFVTEDRSTPNGSKYFLKEERLTQKEILISEIFKGVAGRLI